MVSSSCLHICVSTLQKNKTQIIVSTNWCIPSFINRKTNINNKKLQETQDFYFLFFFSTNRWDICNILSPHKLFYTRSWVLLWWNYLFSFSLWLYFLFCVFIQFQEYLLSINIIRFFHQFWTFCESIVILHFCCCSAVTSCPNLCNPMDCNPPASLCAWDFSAKNTGVGCHFLLQGIFPDQNLCLLHWQLDSLPLRHQGNPFWNLIAFKNSYSSEKQLYGNIKINTKGFQRTYYTGAEVFVKMLYIFYLQHLFKAFERKQVPPNILWYESLVTKKLVNMLLEEK